MAADNVLIPDEGSLGNVNDWILGDLAGAVARLYDASVVWSPADTVVDYPEASFVGYVPATVSSWTPAFLNLAGKAETDSNPLTWTFGAAVGTVLIYGIFLTDVSGTKLLAVVPFLNPVTLSPSNPSLIRVLQLTAVSEL